MINLSDNQIEAIARACHEANRAWCILHGDTSQPAWEHAPEWARTSAVNGVRGALAGNTPRESHEGWLAEKAATGWAYGPAKNPDIKQHPCFVPYDELPTEQRAKDHVFVGVVAAFRAGFESAQAKPESYYDEAKREALNQHDA